MDEDYPMAAMAVESQQRGERVVLQAAQVSYSIGELKLLEDVSVSFQPGQVTALFGPSGAGKSTLLRVMSGRADAVTGDVLVNGAAVSPGALRRLVSLMPQDDLLYPDLSVQQTLHYTAMLRCSPELDRGARLARADAILLKLKLLEVKDNRVGDVIKPGVSGGQRKRVSAAMEFMSDRPALFMDEPTSGLDSTAAKQLGQELVDVSESEHRTVLATIHSPSWALVCLFDKVVLLGEGGRICFVGPPSRISSYFEDAGAPVPEFVNAADHMLNVLAADGSDSWCGVWRGSADCASVRDEVQTARASKTMVDSKDDDDVDSSGVLCDGDTPDTRPRLSRWEQYKVLVTRTFHVWCVDPSQGKLLYVLALCVALLIGSLQFQAGWTVSRMWFNLYYLIAIYLTSCAPLAVLVPSELNVVLREYRNGTYDALPFWAAKVTLTVVNSLVLGTAFSLIVFALHGVPNYGGPNHLIPYPLILVTWMHYTTCMVFGLNLGLLLPSAEVAMRAATVLMIVMFLTSGYFLPKDLMPPWLAWLMYPNIFTFPAKIIACETFGRSSSPAAADILTSPEFFDIDCATEGACWSAMVLILSVLFSTGYLATLRRLNKQDVPAKFVREPKEPPRIVAKVDSFLEKKAAKEDVEAEPEDALLGEPPVAEPLTMDNAASVGSKYISDLFFDVVVVNKVESYGTSSDLITSVDVTASDVWFWHSTQVGKDEPQSVLGDLESELQGLMKTKDPKAPLLDNDLRAENATLSGMSAHFEAGTATALMGPSGCGKTTFLNVLRGRRGPGSFVSGVISANGYEVKKDQFRMLASYTPQENTLLATLTVKETLEYASRLRSPRDWSTEEKKEAAFHVAETLGLAGRYDVKVGTPAEPSLSGGQKKRLSLGMELLAQRPLMLIDEPTTGLDGASALTISRIILDLARLRRKTVVCTLQQPAWTVLCDFDQLVLMRKGRAVFANAPRSVPNFFGQLGAPVEQNESPADHMLFVIQCEAGDETAMKWPKFSPAKSWESLPKVGFVTATSSPYSRNYVAMPYDAATRWTAKSAGELYAVPFMEQYSVLVRRSFRDFFVDPAQMANYFKANVFISTYVGLVFFRLEPSIYIASGISIANVTFSNLALTGLVLVFPNERALIEREYDNGVFSAWAYWLARLTVNCGAVIFIGSLTTPWWWFVEGLPFEADRVFFAVVASVLLATTCAALAGIVGSLSSNIIQAAQLASPFVHILLLFGGLLITENDTKSYWLWAYYFFPTSHAFENLLVLGLGRRGGSGDKAEYNEILDFYSAEVGGGFFRGSTVRPNYAVLSAWLVAVVGIGGIIVTRSFESRRN
ncbi:P-loop containing nucleoside triphosphate hydrolase protein [Pelagophyceae sp. CCMP2097]|nr:P-loop containing nucleoside triphosphate hydrolase protein [Pelagophyceae sp. CCMP2097]